MENKENEDDVIDETTDWRRNPQLLVGKRISMEWKGGKLYVGTVTSYNQYIREHSVIYDEDNQRTSYNMENKQFRILKEDDPEFVKKTQIKPVSVATAAAATAAAAASAPVVSKSAWDNEYSAPLPAGSSTYSTAGAGGSMYGGGSTASAYGGGAYGSAYSNYAYPAPVWAPYVSRTVNAETTVTFYCAFEDGVLRSGDRVRLNGNLEVMSAFGDGVEMAPSATNPNIYEAQLVLPYTLFDTTYYG